MTYTGPKNIVILGGGVAGLAAADAITRALAEYPDPLPDGLRVTLIEGEAHAGGRAMSFPLDAAAHVEHPNAPWSTSTPHGIHFVWGSYAHMIHLCADLGVPLHPEPGPSTYCAWLAPPDIPGDERTPARVVAVHVCDPARPGSAWRVRARHLLQAVRTHAPAVDFLEKFLVEHFAIQVEVDDWLSYMDILFDEENLSAELRWSIFLTGASSAFLGMPETSPVLRALLDGKEPTDADIGELMQPLFSDFVVPRMTRARGALATFTAGDLEDRGIVGRLIDATVGAAWTTFDDVLDAVRARMDSLVDPGSYLGHAYGFATDVVDGLSAVADFLALIVRDAARIASRATTYDPRASGWLKNVLKAAFSSPYGLDVATAMRDAQFGLRSYEGARVRVFDADDARRFWTAWKDRVASRFSSGRVPGEVRTGEWARALVATGDRVTGVETTTSVTRRPGPVPTMRPAALGATTDVLPADAVVSTLVPGSLRALLPAPANEQQRELGRRLDELGRYMNETVNVQLFFPEAYELPFPAVPAGSSETPPFSISNLEGPFTILVDLKRAWSRQAFESIALEEADVGTPFRGTAWELVGNYPDFYSHDPRAHPGRTQWPAAVQQKLAALLHDPDDYDGGRLDTRPWLHDVPAQQPLFGEVKDAKVDVYARKWREEAVPLIVGHTMLHLATMPGMARSTSDALRALAKDVLEGRPTRMKWTVVRNCHCENRFFSAEPGIYGLRPHARFQSALRGLWISGDWARNGLNVQAMESAVVSGLQSACGVLEHMRAGGLTKLRPPLVDPRILPPGAWDPGP